MSCLLGKQNRAFLLGVLAYSFNSHRSPRIMWATYWGHRVSKTSFGLTLTKLTFRESGWVGAVNKQEEKRWEHHRGAHLLAHLLPPGSTEEDLFEEVMCKRRSAGPNTFASLRGEMTVRRGLFQERHTPRQRHSPRKGKQVQGLRKSQTAGCAGGRVGVGGCGLLTRHHGTIA